jgi:hypothetical protein
VSTLDLIGLGVLGLFIVLLLLSSALLRRRPPVFRPIPSFQSLGTAIQRAVEAGERVHLSLGTGSVIGSDSAPAFAGLAVLKHMAASTSMSDRPPVVSAGDGAMAILAGDSLRSVYEGLGAGDRFDPNSARMLAPTPFSYAAGLPTVLGTEDISVHMLIGSFGAEGALAADFGERRNLFVLGGTDDVQAQALLYVAADHPLIGEEVFAGGAYLEGAPLHRASLTAQDWVRMLVVIAVVVGVILRTFGVGL